MTQTIRERAVEGAARAIWRVANGSDNTWADLPGNAQAKAICIQDATAAYDAILAALSDPTHDMIEAGIVHDNLTSAGLRDAWRAMVQEAGR